MLWPTIKQSLHETLPESAYSLWVEPLTCRRDDADGLELVGPDRFFCSWVSEHYLPTIQQSLATLGKEEMAVRISVAPPDKQRSRQPHVAATRDQLRLPNMPPARTCIRALHPRYTFEEFMVGESNFLPHSACEALARNDSALGNCVYINAGTGLGKSHLTHAVAHHIVNHAPGTRLHYLTGQQLTAEMVRCIKSNTMENFKDKYQNQCDMLLMEDIHTLAGRTKTQVELAAALDVLMESGKRIIFTGAVPPKDIPDIAPEFRSRLSFGLITTINPPDLETRVLIIKRKALTTGLQLSEDLVGYLAENIKGDIRQVGSAIVGLKAKSSFMKTAPDFDMVKEVVSSIVGRSQELSVEMIRDFVAGQFKAKISDLQSKSRKKSIAFPRQVAMYLARKLTEQALSDIGKAFNRDHSTVVHSVRVITESMARNGSVRGQVELLTTKLRRQFS